MILFGKANKPRSDFLGAVGRRLAANRDSVPHMTQEDLAKIAETNRSHLALIELGRVDVKIETLRSLTKALGITLSDLFRGLD